MMTYQFCKELKVIEIQNTNTLLRKQNFKKEYNFFLNKLCLKTDYTLFFYSIRYRYVHFGALLMSQPTPLVPSLLTAVAINPTTSLIKTDENSKI